MAQQDKSWEGEWKAALENKSISPPAGIWEGIEAELDRSSGKRSLLPVWWMVAATLSVFAATGIFVYESNKAGGIENHISGSSDKEQLRANKRNDTNVLALEKDNKIDDDEKNGVGIVGSHKLTRESEVNYNAEETEVNTVASTPSKDSEIYDFLPGLVEKMKAVVFDFELPEVPELWGVPATYAHTKKVDDSWYAGINLSAGASASSDAFSDNAVSYASFAEADSYNQYNSTSSLSSSTSYGMSVGKKIAKRVIVETGLSYVRIENTGRSNIALASESGRSTYNKNAALMNATMTTTTPYELKHVHQFISIPLKAGYLLIDNKWKMSVNAGVSGDYFIKTQTEDLSGNLDSYETNPTTDPLWNSFAMSVIGEVSLSRQLGSHYIIALSPEVRQSISDLSNTSEELKPFIMQIGIQLKYKF